MTLTSRDNNIISELLERFTEDKEFFNKFTEDFSKFSEQNFVSKEVETEVSGVDKIYKELVEKILSEGQVQTGKIRAQYADGEPAYTTYLPNALTLTFKPEYGLPILKSKPVAVKSFLAELDWIWRRMSNDVQELRDMGSTIWDEWENENGTIGKAYGYQLAQTSRGGLNQVENLIKDLKENPKSRRIMTSIYIPEDLDDMALEPCVFLTNWQVDENNKLHLNVVQRSADCALGIPFNWAQYGVLHRRIAQVTGLELGNMNWTIFNAHIYNRHVPLLREQIKEITANDIVEVKLPESLDYFNTPLTEVEILNYNPIEKDVKPKDRKYRYEVAE